MHLSEVEEAAFPITVEAKALEIIEEIVPAGNFGKELVYFCGALIAFVKIWIGHRLIRPGIGASAHNVQEITRYRSVKTGQQIGPKLLPASRAAGILEPG